MRSFLFFFVVLLLATSGCFAQDEFDAPPENSTAGELANFDLENLNTTLPTNASAKVEQDPKCSLEADRGNGTSEFKQFFYDPKSKTCKEFTYSGEAGNGNRFSTQEDCLNDCYIEKGRRYFYSHKYQSCLAYRSCGGDDVNYETRAECESNCKPADGSVCGPSQESKEAVRLGTDCESTECPKGSSCLQGMIPQCCTNAPRDDVDFLYAEKCPNGQAAGGTFDQYFLPEVAENCEDLDCEHGYECQRLKGLAKCCRSAKKSGKSRELVAHDAPLVDSMQREKLQRFYFDPGLQSCFAFKYSGCQGTDNRFLSRADCESACLVADLSACRGNQRPAVPMRPGTNCAETICPSPYVCTQGMHGPESKFNALYEEKCPGGRPASGRQIGDVFEVTFAKTCSDLLCPYGYSCEQLDVGLAKCCQWPLFSRDQPLNAGSTVLLSDSEVVRKIWSTPRIISAEGLIQHLNTICSKYEEYRGCLTTMTNTAACLDPILARKEQMFGFVCQRAVRETISSTENQRCLRRISKLRRIQDCEDRLTNGLVNNEFDKFTICRAFDRTLECAATELLKCGPNAFWLTKNIIHTLKGPHLRMQWALRVLNLRIERSGDQRGGGGGSKRDADLATTVQARVAATKTHVPTDRKANRRPPRKECPEDRIERAEGCAAVLGHRKLREIFRLPADFVFGNFELGNIHAYCNRSQSYRRCMELSLSSDENCLVHLKEDFAYSFIVAFDDRLCERDKQLKWLINSGCLSDVLQLNKTKACLNDLETTDERVLCRTLDQMESCVMPIVEKECRLQEVQFFRELFEMVTPFFHLSLSIVWLEMQKRKRLCSPSNVTLPLGALRAKFLRQLALHDDASQMSRPLSLKGCRSARKIAIFVNHHFVPRVHVQRRVQSHSKSGNCWCVDEESGMPQRNSLVGPGRPLPMCGAASLFTCDQLPTTRFCDADGSAPQKVERWFRSGDECVRYLHTMCPSSSHLPPMPLRNTVKACQSFCLPVDG
ncbi:Major allergen Ani s 1 [Aphelenchoides fujianensis]|nr:Major allergen Ani s 1 [Aphelenchoides fujianensis]